MIVTILGSDSLIGQHLIGCIQKQSEEHQLRCWTYECIEFKNEASLGIDINRLEVSYGLSNLPTVMKGADLVINLHECQDLTLLPQRYLLDKHNVEFVRRLLAHLTSPLIHLSTVFLQCSSRWPNVFEQESKPDKYRSKWPFAEYCSSKLEAEKLIEANAADYFIVRSVPLYGEGDDGSILTDLINMTGEWNIPLIGEVSLGSTVPVIGDRGGVMQMAYAGNVAAGLWTSGLYITGKMSERNTVQIEEKQTVEGSSDSTKKPTKVSAAPASRVLGGLFGPSSFSPEPIIEEKEEELLEHDTDEGMEAGENDVETEDEEEDEDYYKDDESDKTEEKESESAEKTQETDEAQQEEDKEEEDHEDKRTYEESQREDQDQVAAPVETEKHHREIVILADDAPNKDVYTLYEATLTNGKRSLSCWSIPLLPIYYLYSMFSFFIVAMAQLIELPSILYKLPHPALLYFYFHHWTFFNTFKAQVLLGYKPPFSHTESLNRCKPYYHVLRSDDVKNFFWVPRRQ